MDFFYDHQIRRYLLQFMRAFSDIRVRNGPDANGLYTIQRVPILYGDPSRMAAQIAKGVSENTLLPSPLFSAYIKDIKMAPGRRQDPMFVAKSSVIEREFDSENNNYKSSPGVRQDIEMYMPVPYDLVFVLDVWTTNITTKLQIFEQLAVVYNPSIQLQQNANLQDWTSIFKMILENIVWSSRTIPQGEGNERDVMTFEFKIEAWITPPARVKRSTIISQIVTNVHYTSDIETLEKSIDNTYDAFGCLGIRSMQIITTEGNYHVSVYKGESSDEIQLLSGTGLNSSASWQALIQRYGSIVPKVTKLKLKLNKDIETDQDDIIGYITLDSNRDDILLFAVDVDTLPSPTIPPIDDIIDPSELHPGKGLPAPLAGQRYLLVSKTSHGEEPAIPFNVPSSPWGMGFVAYPNDIIEFNGIEWVVIFNSNASATKNFVINKSNGTHYSFTPDGGWTYTYYGTYTPGYWRIDDISGQGDEPIIA